jgi:hypothetical protein
MVRASGADDGGVDAAFIIKLVRWCVSHQMRSAVRLNGWATMKFEGKLTGHELKPRATRIDVRYDALVRFERTAVQAMILNVSSDGFRLHASEELEAGTEVTIECQKLEPVRGKIHWSCGQEAGGVFLEAIAL